MDPRNLLAISYDGRMRQTLVFVMVIGCTTSAEPAKPTPPARTLDEFQLDCRASQLAYLNEANTRIGPTCGQQTMPVTLGSFDQGSTAASLDARHMIKTLTFVCICEETHCDEARMADSRQHLANAVTSQKESYRVGVDRLASGLAGSTCLDSTVAGELFQHGYVCAFDEVTTSQTLRREMEANFARLVPGPPGQATELAAKCWNSAVPPPAVRPAL